MQKQGRSHDVATLRAIIHVVERIGLAMAGAMCGTFVAALQTKVNAALFDSAPFIATMVLVGIAGFYLGIDMPRRSGLVQAEARAADAVEFLSAIGTFLAAVAALISVYAFVFDVALSNISAYTVASWWMLGVAMQVTAGVTARLRLAVRA